MRYCVFAGSSTGHDANFRKAADCLGAVLAQRGIGLVYGGASVGLMGIVADAAQSHGGEVIGVIPRSLVEKEVAHGGLADLRIVESMHERKALTPPALEWNGLPIVTAAGLEAGLIKMIQPPWNKAGITDSLVPK